jgi:uncharacterized membrane protein YGL010W
MQQIQYLFADYAEAHQTKGNKLFHRMGIPLIVLTLMGMLARVELGPADLALVVIALSTVFYLTLDWRLAIPMLAVSLGFWWLGRLIPFWWNVAGFVLGWIFQFIGHSFYEHKQPKFLRNLTHLMVGPLWILNDVIPVVKPSDTATRSSPAP